jgi:hypothetical protein
MIDEPNGFTRISHRSSGLRLPHHAVTVLGADVFVRSTQDGYPSEPLVGRLSWRARQPG